MQVGRRHGAGARRCAARDPTACPGCLARARRTPAGPLSARTEPPPLAGSTAKINQDRGLAIYPYGTDSDAHARGLFGVFDGHGRIVSTPRRAPEPLGGRPFNRC